MLKRILSLAHRFRCPDEQHLAAYVDQQLIGAERQRVECHLASCDACLQQVGFLTRQAQAEVSPVQPWLVARAGLLEQGSHHRSALGWRGAIAGTVAVMAISATVWRQAQPDRQEKPAMLAKTMEASAPAGPSQAKDSDADTSVRSETPIPAALAVLSPEAGAMVSSADFTIRWYPVADAAGYDVRVVTADGDMVWSKRVRTTSVKPPDRTVRPGIKYFVWIRAILPDGETQESAAVSFIGG